MGGNSPRHLSLETPGALCEPDGVMQWLQQAAGEGGISKTCMGGREGGGGEGEKEKGEKEEEQKKRRKKRKRKKKEEDEEDEEK